MTECPQHYLHSFTVFRGCKGYGKQVTDRTFLDTLCSLYLDTTKHMTGLFATQATWTAMS